MKHKRKLTPEELSILEQLSILRMPMDQMATTLGMSEDTLERMCKTYDAVRAAIYGGRAKASRQARQTLFQMAMGHEAKYDAKGKLLRPAKPPRFSALKFWCQTQEGFKITEKLEHSGPDGSAIEIAEKTKAIFDDPEVTEAARKVAEAFMRKPKNDAE